MDRSEICAPLDEAIGMTRRRKEASLESRAKG